MQQPDQAHVVSVIIPVHNGEPYLAEAIESVLAQTYRSIELIVADDGSTDGSREIAVSYEAVNYLYQPNSGTGAARNLGVRNSKGEFLAFLDADDVWIPDKLALQLAAFEADPNLAIVSGLVEQFAKPGQHERYSFPAAPQPGYSPIAILIKRRAFEALGGFDEGTETAETISWMDRLVDTYGKLLILPVVVARRRIHGSNKSIRREEDKNHIMLRHLKSSMERKRAKAGSRDDN